MKISLAVWLLLMLAVSWQDLKKQEISVKLLILIGAVGTGFQLFEGSISLRSWLGGVALGGFLLFLGFVTRENIGYGDGWLVTATGMALGFRFTCLGLLLALGGSALVSGCLLVFGRVKRSYRIPFAPFFLLGCVLGFACGG